MMVNIDGFSKEVTQLRGWGFRGNLERVIDPLHAEAQALLQASIIACQMGCQHATID
jgi:succinylarginine dihydrolase